METSIINASIHVRAGAEVSADTHGTGTAVVNIDHFLVWPRTPEQAEQIARAFVKAADLMRRAAALEAS